METPQEYPQEQPQEYPRRAEDNCATCGADQWYLDAGTKLCENGHEDEANDRPDDDFDDQFGNLGRRAVAGKEEKENVDLRPTSKEAVALYLLGLQTILRKQVSWLIETQGVDPELETVCKNLWELRVFKLPWMPRKELDDSSDSDSDLDSDSNENGNEARDDGFSSQTDTDSAESLQGASTTDEEEVEADDEGYKMDLRRKSKVWDWSDRDALPVVSDTLAILYLGCVLRKEPIRIGDIFKWAKNDHLPYLGALILLPPSHREVLPLWAHRALLDKPATLRGTELYFDVMTLMLGYHKNYSMVFPKIPIARRLLRYVEELALPPAVYMATQDICARADLGFTFPTERGRDASTLSKFFRNKPQSLIQLPEALLVAAMVVAVKYIYPLDKIERFPVDENDPLTLKMDWATWERSFTPPENTDVRPRRLDFKNLAPKEIEAMSSDDMDDYLTWYENARVDRIRSKYGDADIKGLFPLGPSNKPNPVVKERSYQDLAEEQEEQIKKIMKLVHSAMTVVEPRDGDNVLRIGSLYQPLRKPKHAEGVTKRFYQVVAEMSGLGFRHLVAVVYKLESILKEKDAEERRARKKNKA
ncbi:hypothetical protein V8F33_009394 [Rhypophila sp. PSN 637]